MPIRGSTAVRHRTDPAAASLDRCGSSVENRQSISRPSPSPLFPFERSARIHSHLVLVAFAVRRSFPAVGDSLSSRGKLVDTHASRPCLWTISKAPRNFGTNTEGDKNRGSKPMLSRVSPVSRSPLDRALQPQPRDQPPFARTLARSPSSLSLPRGGGRELRLNRVWPTSRTQARELPGKLAGPVADHYPKTTFVSSTGGCYGGTYTTLV